MTTYTPIARLPLMTPFDPAVANAWGPILNAAYPLIEQTAAGIGSVDLTGVSTYTLTIANDAADQARPGMLSFIGAPSGSCTVTLPAVARFGFVTNAASNSVVLTCGGTGTTLTVPTGTSFLYTCDGANIAAVTLSAPSGVATAGSVTIPNAANYEASDSGGTARPLLGIDSANNTNLTMGGSTSWRVLNQAGTTTLMSITPAGAVTLPFTLAVTGNATVGGTLAVTGNTTVTGTLTATGALTANAGLTTTTVTATSGFTVPFNQFFYVKDSTGTAHPVLGTTGSTATTLYNALGGTFQILSQTGAASLFSLTNAGVGTFLGGLSIGGVLTAPSVSLSGTLTAATATISTVTCTNMSVTSGLTVTGNFSCSGTTTVGAISGATTYMSGNITCATFNASGNITGAAQIQGNSLVVLTNAIIEGNCNISNTCTAANYVTSSDRRLKSEIEDLTPAMGYDWVQRGRPRTYLMNGRVQAGFIAQEDLAVGRGVAVSAQRDSRPSFAEGDHYTAPGTSLVRNYDIDVAYLTAALQGALARIADLEAKLA